MKHLIVNDRISQAYFEDESTVDEIKEWLQDNLETVYGLFLLLNEPHSCSVSIYDDDMILISGDEDRVEIEVKTIYSINVN